MCYVPVTAIVQISLGIINLTVCTHCVEAPIGIHIDDRLSSLSFFSGDNDDTVSRFGTIYSSCRSIFQHVNLTDVLGIDFRKFAIELHTIQNNQRIIVPTVRIDGTLSAKHILHCFGSFGSQFVWTNLNNRTCQVLFTHGTVPHNYHFLQHFGILFQYHFYSSLSVKLNLLRLVSHKRNHQSGLGRDTH